MCWIAASMVSTTFRPLCASTSSPRCETSSRPRLSDPDTRQPGAPRSLASKLFSMPSQPKTSGVWFVLSSLPHKTEDVRRQWTVWINAQFVSLGQKSHSAAGFSRKTLTGIRLLFFIHAKRELAHGRLDFHPRLLRDVFLQPDVMQPVGDRLPPGIFHDARRQALA